MSDYWDLDITKLRSIVQREPDDIEAWWNLGGKLVCIEDYKEAGKVFEEVIRKNPEFADGHLQLAHAYYQTEKLDGAVCHAERAVALDPENADAYSDLGLYLNAKGKERDAEESLRIALRLDNTNEMTWLWLGNVLLDTDRLEDACDAYMRAILLKADDYLAWIGLGKGFYELTRLAEAENALNVAHSLSPDSSEPLFYKMYTYTELEEWSRVEMICKELIESEQSEIHEADIRSHLGRALFYLDHEEEAEQQLSRVVLLEERDLEAWKILAQLYNVTGRIEEAEEAYSNAISLSPYDKPLHEDLATLFNEMGMAEEGRAQREVIHDLFEREDRPDPTRIRYHEIDESIRVHIQTLNDLELRTWDSCSGLIKDHTDREKFSPYVAFEVDAPKKIHWLFTIADMAGWKANYGVNGSGVSLRLEDTHDDLIDLAWEDLIEAATTVMGRIFEMQDDEPDWSAKRS